MGLELSHIGTRAIVVTTLLAVCPLFAVGLGATPTHASPPGNTYPAKIQVLRAGVEEGSLDVLADITKRADGDRVSISLNAKGKKFRFTAPIKDGRIRFQRLLPSSQRHASTGIMEISYKGNDRVRPTEVRLRAANGKAHLQRDLLSLDNGVITARGSLTAHAHGVVRLILSYERPDGTVGEWQGRASISDGGNWRLEENLPADARGGGYLSIQFTGSYPRRIRGEQIAKQLLDGQAFSREPAPAANAPASADGLLSDDFSRANGPNDLITNEYAFWNPDPLGVRSPNWEVTSGSLFSKNGVGWSGHPDAITPIGSSINGTGSNVFRMRTKGTHTGSARQEVSARINGFGAGTSARPPTAWDGVVLWPRYLSETNLYFAYILRRDGRVAITKKCDGKLPGGGYYNNGTYFGLTSERYYADTIPGTWYRLGTEAVDNPDGSVTIRLYRDGQLAAEATDTGIGCPPIRGKARLGIRGDNTDFNIKDYTSNRIA